MSDCIAAYDRIMELARKSIANPPYGRDKSGSFSQYAPGNLVSNAFVLGLLTAAQIVRGAKP